MSRNVLTSEFCFTEVIDVQQDDTDIEDLGFAPGMVSQQCLQCICLVSIYIIIAQLHHIVICYYSTRFVVSI